MRRPATEAILTIAPPPRFRICGMTAWVPLNGPRRLTAMTRSQSATGIAAIVWRVIVPAELTSTSMPPAFAAIFRSEPGEGGAVSDIERVAGRAVADLGRDALGRRAGAVAHR